MTCFVQDVDKATSSRIILEKKLEQLEAEIEFLKRVHQQVKWRLCKRVTCSNTSHFFDYKCLTFCLPGNRRAYETNLFCSCHRSNCIDNA